MTTFWNDLGPKLEPKYTRLRGIYLAIIYPFERGIFGHNIPFSEGYIIASERGIKQTALRGV